MPTRTSVIRLGSRVQFKDRWSGHLSAFEADEQWEVINVIVTRGLWRRSSVKLPLSAASAYNDEQLTFEQVTSVQAFAREIPPLAAPARPLSRETPLALSGASLLGAVLEMDSRRGRQLLIARRGQAYRLPVTDVSFQGKVLHIAAQAETLMPYRTDGELEELARRALADGRDLTPADRRALQVDVLDGIVHLSGNARTRQTAEAARRSIEAAAPVSFEVIDEAQLETDIGQALDRAGLQRLAGVYARATMGDVIIYGSAPSQTIAEEVARAVARVPGVGSVTNRLQVRSGGGTPRGPELLVR